MLARRLPDTQVRGLVVSATVQDMVDSRQVKQGQIFRERPVIFKINNKSRINSLHGS